MGLGKVGGCIQCSKPLNLESFTFRLWSSQEKERKDSQRSLRSPRSPSNLSGHLMTQLCKWISECFCVPDTKQALGAQREPIAQVAILPLYSVLLELSDRVLSSSHFQLIFAARNASLKGPKAWQNSSGKMPWSIHTVCLRQKMQAEEDLTVLWHKGFQNVGLTH